MLLSDYSPEQQKIIAKGRARRQRVRAHAYNLPAWFKRRHWLACLEWWGETCAYCGISAADLPDLLECDHYYPLRNAAVGSVPHNILPCCTDCNQQKDRNNPTDWIYRRFGQQWGDEIIANIEAYFSQVERWSQSND